MNSGQDLIISMREQRTLLIDTVQAMKVIGRKLAESDLAYRIAYRKEVFRLREVDGVAWTSCGDLARGDDIVGKLRFTREVHQSDYDCCIEKIHQIKFEMRILESEINREWGQKQ